MQNSDHQTFKFSASERGFSLIELLIVIVIMTILTSALLITLNREKLYAADDQALIITGALQKARQLAITSKTVIRVEINQTQNNLQIFDEKIPTTANDDVLLETSLLKSDTITGIVPANVTQNPTASYSIPVTNFETSVYPPVANDQTMTFRFTITGNVLDRGSNAVGKNAIVTGATIFVSNSPWDANNGATIIRAITLNGITGDSIVQKGLLNAAGYCDSWKR